VLAAASAVGDNPAPAAGDSAGAGPELRAEAGAERIRATFVAAARASDRTRRISAARSSAVARPIAFSPPINFLISDTRSAAVFGSDVAAGLLSLPSTSHDRCDPSPFSVPRAPTLLAGLPMSAAAACRLALSGPTASDGSSIPDWPGSSNRPCVPGSAPSGPRPGTDDDGQWDPLCEGIEISQVKGRELDRSV